MVPRGDSILISLILLFATATAAQEVTSPKRAEAHHAGGTNEDNAQAFNGKKAADAARASGVTKRAAERSDFNVLVWYRRDDPLGTFKYEVYDVRKGEYTAAVDAWVRNIETKYPAYLVVVRGVDLKREHGETEKLKVGSVIKHELMAAAGMSGVFLDGGASLSPGPGPGVNRAPRPAASMGSLNRPLGAAGTDRSYLNPLPTPFPVPVPYPRPHP
ncbi:MAG: hypothetical protein ACLQIB_03785 [Isosphaeraceae bacterium]